MSTGALVMVKGPANGGRRAETYWLAGQSPEPKGDHSGFSRRSTDRSRTTAQLGEATKPQEPSQRPRLRLVTTETRTHQRETQTAAQAVPGPTQVGPGKGDSLADILTQW